LWLPEEVLALLFLHHENGDFSVLMKDMLYWMDRIYIS
jgi:hypothetical protein